MTTIPIDFGCQLLIFSEEEIRIIRQVDIFWFGWHLTTKEYKAIIDEKCYVSSCQITIILFTVASSSIPSCDKRQIMETYRKLC
jgi:hypothetical protein